MVNAFAVLQSLGGGWGPGGGGGGVAAAVFHAGMCCSTSSTTAGSSIPAACSPLLLQSLYNLNNLISLNTIRTILRYLYGGTHLVTEITP